MNSKKAPLSRLKKAKAGLVGLFVALVILGAATPVQADENTDMVVDLVDEYADQAPGKNGCNKTEGGNGGGDNHAKCDMTCDKDRVLKISVDSADDEGRWPASVSGEIDCGGGHADCFDDEGHCSGGGSTQENAKVTSTGQGTCKGESDELVESTLTVGCSAEKVSVPGGGDPLGKWCPISIGPLPICIDPLPGGVDQILRELIENPPVGPEEYRQLMWDLQYALDKTAHPVLFQVGSALGYVAEAELEHSLEPQPLGDEFELVDSENAQTWDQAIAIDPLLPWNALAHESYVWMHFDGTAALGINCYKAVCHDFAPLLVNGEDGFVLATP